MRVDSTEAHRILVLLGDYYAHDTRLSGHNSDSPCDDTGLWRVELDYDERGQRTCSVIHIDTILRSAHLIGVAGPQLLPKHFTYYDSLYVLIRPRPGHTCNNLLSRPQGTQEALGGRTVRSSEVRLEVEEGKLVARMPDGTSTTTELPRRLNHRSAETDQSPKCRDD